MYQVATVESKKERDPWTEDTRERYAALRQDILSTISYLRNPGAFESLFESLRDAIDDEMVLIKQEIDHPTLLEKDYHSQEARAKALHYRATNLQRQYEALKSFVSDRDNGVAHENRFVLNSPTDFRRAFDALQPHKNLHESMRNIVFAWAMRKNPAQVRLLEDLTEEPSIDAISKMHNFIDHVVNQETFGEYFDNKKAASRFKQMSSVSSLEDAMKRHQQLAEKTGKTGLQIIPTRGLMMELSGYIGDACWAGGYDSIAEAMPNMIALIMKQNPDTNKEKLVGSALLIETADESGTPTLVLRGVNPVENYINKTDVEEFYNAITDYVKQVARERGMKPAIVIDDHSGGSASNRPVLFGYMRAQITGESKLEHIRVNSEDTNFNGYAIEGVTYRLKPTTPPVEINK